MKLSAKYWMSQIAAGSGFAVLFQVIGIGWTLIEVVYCIEPLIAIRRDEITLVLIVVAFFCGAWTAWPRRFAQHSVQGIDAEVEVCICDAFTYQDALIVVPINSTFDVKEERFQTTSSMQGQLLQIGFANDVDKLNDEITKALSNSTASYTTLTVSPLGQSGRRRDYELGTTIAIRNENRNFILIASSSLTKGGGRAEMQYKDLLMVLGCMWGWISDHAPSGNIIVPLIGTGKGRLSATREQVAKLIVASAFPALQSKKFSEKIIVAIHPEDAKRNKIDFKKIRRFIKQLE